MKVAALCSRQKEEEAGVDLNKLNAVFRAREARLVEKRVG